MRIPVKRPCSRINPEKVKIKKPNIEPKSKTVLNHFSQLKKELLLEILNFLDTKTVCKIIPSINTYFYLFIKTYKKYLTSFQLPIIVFRTKLKNFENYNSNLLKLVSNTDQLVNLQIYSHKKNKEITSEYLDKSF